MKVIDSVSFLDLSIYIMELKVSEVKEAKKTEVNNLLDYDVIEEVKDEGEDTTRSR